MTGQSLLRGLHGPKVSMGLHSPKSDADCLSMSMLMEVPNMGRGSNEAEMLRDASKYTGSPASFNRMYNTLIDYRASVLSKQALGKAFVTMGGLPLPSEQEFVIFFRVPTIAHRLFLKNIEGSLTSSN